MVGPPKSLITQRFQTTLSGYILRSMVVSVKEKHALDKSDGVKMLGEHCGDELM